MSRNERLLISAQVGLLVASATLACSVSSEASDWQPLSLFVLLLAGRCQRVFRLDVKAIHISAAFLAHVLAMTLLGPAPATVIGLS